MFDPAPGNRSRKVSQIPREKILDAAHGRDRNVQGVIRNGYRDETPGEQEGGEHLNVVRDLKEPQSAMRARRLAAISGLPALASRTTTADATTRYCCR